MQCAHCGTEIADKAFICYRCGEATVEAKLKPPVSRRRRWPVIGWSVVALVGSGLYVGQVVTDGAPSPVGWMLGALALAGLLWGLIRR